MKTDKEILIDMFKRAKLEYKEWPESGGLYIEAGYIGFCSNFYFNEDGSLKSVEAYE